MHQSTPLHSGFPGTTKYGKYYRHSGQVNVPGMLAGLVIGCVAGAVLGVVYSSAVVFIPFIKLRAILCLFYGFLIGSTPAVILKKLKVRNLPMSMALVTLVTLVSFYISWTSWEWLAWRNTPNFPPFAKLVSNPKEVYRIATVTVHTGTWGLVRGEPWKGTLLEVLWLAEAACVFGCSLITLNSMLRQSPFCEKCEQWCSGPHLIRTTAATDLKELKNRLEAGDFAYVSKLPAPDGTAFIEFHRHQCEKCNEINTVSVVSRVLRKDRKGRIRSNQRKPVLSQLLISTGDLEKLMPTASAPVSGSKLAMGRKPMQSPQSL